MENSSFTLNAIVRKRTEYLPEIKARCWQHGHQLPRRVEVLCPEPRRYTYSPKSRIIMPVPRKDFGLKKEYGAVFLDLINSKDEAGVSSSETPPPVGFFECSPPARSENPMVNDLQFAKKAPIASSPPSGTPNETGSTARGHGGRGFPSRGSFSVVQPRVRIEGFSCRRSMDPRDIVT